MSRLASPAAEPDIGLFWHGAAGLVLGLCAALPPLLLLPALWPGPALLIALLCALLWLALEAWLTRGLHWDAVADLGDALGSGASGEKFRAILKDSRLGAFGAMTLGLGMAAQTIAAAAHFYGIAQGRLTPLAALILAPAWARLAPAWLGYQGKPCASPSLGALVCDAMTKQFWLWSWAQAAFILFLLFGAGLSALRCILILLAQLLLNFLFRRLAIRHGGLSGDFFGAHIEAAQLLFLFFSIRF